MYVSENSSDEEHPYARDRDYGMPPPTGPTSLDDMRTKLDTMDLDAPTAVPEVIVEQGPEEEESTSVLMRPVPVTVYEHPQFPPSEQGSLLRSIESAGQASDDRREHQQQLQRNRRQAELERLKDVQAIREEAARKKEEYARRAIKRDEARKIWKEKQRRLQQSARDSDDLRARLEQAEARNEQLLNTVQAQAKELRMMGPQQQEVPSEPLDPTSPARVPEKAVRSVKYQPASTPRKATGAGFWVSLKRRLRSAVGFQRGTENKDS